MISRHIILIKKVYCQIIDGKIDGFLSFIEVECFDSIPIAGQYLVFLRADTKWGPTVGLGSSEAPPSGCVFLIALS